MKPSSAIFFYFQPAKRPADRKGSLKREFALLIVQPVSVRLLQRRDCTLGKECLAGAVEAGSLKGTYHWAVETVCFCGTDLGSRARSEPTNRHGLHGCA